MWRTLASRMKYSIAINHQYLLTVENHDNTAITAQQIERKINTEENLKYKEQLLTDILQNLLQNWSAEKYFIFRGKYKLPPYDSAVWHFTYLCFSNDRLASS